MNVGLLWHDARPVTEALPAAVARYVARFGQQPNVCYVHPTAAGTVTQINQVHVRPSDKILKQHLWLGRED